MLRNKKQTRGVLPVTPKKCMGQHFLIDEHAIDRIVAALELGSADLLVEIGPGTGATHSSSAPRVWYPFTLRGGGSRGHCVPRGALPLPNYAIAPSRLSQIRLRHITRRPFGLCRKFALQYFVANPIPAGSVT